MLDVDGNGTADALTDGILMMRYLFDPNGTWGVSDALGFGATRTTRTAVKAALDQYRPVGPELKAKPRLRRHGRCPRKLSRLRGN